MQSIIKFHRNNHVKKMIVEIYSDDTMYLHEALTTYIICMTHAVSDSKIFYLFLDVLIL